MPEGRWKEGWGNPLFFVFFTLLHHSVCFALTTSLQLSTLLINYKTMALPLFADFMPAVLMSVFRVSKWLRGSLDQMHTTMVRAYF